MQTLIYTATIWFRGKKERKVFSFNAIMTFGVDLMNVVLMLDNGEPCTIPSPHKPEEERVTKTSSSTHRQQSTKKKRSHHENENNTYTTADALQSVLLHQNSDIEILTIFIYEMGNSDIIDI
uniref:Uncharacterized protein n=1 Tax=Megaselia scalaris TaxID=36166 RepID=T1GHS3_MEGSC